MTDRPSRPRDDQADERALAAKLRDATPPPPEEAAARVWAAVEARLGGPSDPGGGAAPSGGGAVASSVSPSRLAGVALSSFALGAVVSAMVTIGVMSRASAPPAPPRQPSLVTPTPEAEEERALLAPPPPAPPSRRAEPTDAESRSSSTPRPRTAPSSNEGARAEPAAEEASLIDHGRVALGRGDTYEALTALMAHERRFPEGLLREERERLTIEALVVSGRRERATARALEFRARYPESAHLGRIDAILGRQGDGAN